MSGVVYEIKGKVWLYPGPGGWHFVSIPPKQSSEINERFGMRKGGWGSLPVSVKIGETEWKTSIFRDRKSNTYLLAIKAEVRRKEKIESGDKITASVRIE